LAVLIVKFPCPVIDFLNFKERRRDRVQLGLKTDLYQIRLNMTLNRMPPAAGATGPSPHRDRDFSIAP
jgi:hypothetical protein